MTDTADRTAKIRALNDQFRQTLQGGRLWVTSGIQSLGPHRLLGILRMVRSFDAFTEDNDPYGEHDFGSFVEGGDKVFWQISYFSKDMSAGSDNPSERDQTTRVLTIMLSEEY